MDNPCCSCKLSKRVLQAFYTMLLAKQRPAGLRLPADCSDERGCGIQRYYKSAAGVADIRRYMH